MLKLSFITATYNRKDLLTDSLRSAIACWKTGAADCEFIVIDDCSSDGTLESLRQNFGQLIVSGVIRVERLERNQGVTAARNRGVQLARYDWIVFLDSDDTFIAENFAACVAEIARFPSYDAFFFRCRDHASGTLVGPQRTEPYALDLRGFLRDGTPGESPIVVRREILLKYPFDPDLRGFEGLTYARVLKDIGSALVSPQILRNYDQNDSRSRLSSRAGIRSRAALLAKGYVRMLSEFFWELPALKRARTVVAIAYYSALSISKGPNRTEGATR